MQQGDALTVARGAFTLRQAAAAVSVTPVARPACAVDVFELRQPAQGAAAESPTQSKLRSLLKVQLLPLRRSGQSVDVNHTAQEHPSCLPRWPPKCGLPTLLLPSEHHVTPLDTIR
jgi:hypothetical protein